MENLIKLFKLLMSKLPDAVKTKINKSGLDRGGNGVFTARRKRSDKVIIPFKSFKDIWNYDTNAINNIFINGYRVLCTPCEYFLNSDFLINIPVIVRYQSYDEIEQYPIQINWEDIKNNRKDYLDNEVMYVQDIKNLDKFANKGKSKYVGPKHIGQHEMDYSNDQEILNVQMCLLFQAIKCDDFKSEMSKHPMYQKCLEYGEKFEESLLYIENPKLQEYTTKYGFTVCPILILFPNKTKAKVLFSDIIDGKIEGDVGREEFNRTTTKINIHHLDRLISGKQNHNHKNVFLGTSAGNAIDAALRSNNIQLFDLLKKS